MKIATWNVNSIRTRQQIVIDWLESNNIDVLCLQETKVIDQDFPCQPFLDRGYHLYISGQKSYNGVAMFSRFPLEDVIVGFAPLVGDRALEFDEQKRAISGIIDGIRIVNLYVPNGSEIGSEKYEYKLNWLKILQEYLESLKKRDGMEICICGDFNIALEDRDIYNPQGKDRHIMASPAEREALQEVLAIGLSDAFRKFTSETGHFSWWDYRAAGFAKNRGWRIDSFYLTAKLYARSLDCKIDIEPRKLNQPSDHAPVILEIDRM
jgi:exodeoxyribonuclease-3